MAVRKYRPDQSREDDGRFRDEGRGGGRGGGRRGTHIPDGADIVEDATDFRERRGRGARAGRDVDSAIQSGDLRRMRRVLNRYRDDYADGDDKELDAHVERLSAAIRNHPDTKYLVGKALTKSASKQPRRRKMKRFRLDEISAVDKPAQEGALATLMKRKRERLGVAKADSALVTQIVDHYLANGSDGFAAYSHASIAKQMDAAKAEPCWPYFEALQTSLQSIVRDDSLSDNDRVRLMKSSASDFVEAAQKELPGFESYLRKGLNEGSMNLTQLRKQMADLSRKVDSLVPKLDAVVKQRTRKADEEMPDEGDEEAAAERLRNLLGTSKNTGEYDDFMAEKAEEEEFFEDEETEKGEDPEMCKPTSEGEEEEPISAGSPTPIGGKRADKRLVIGADSIMVGSRTITKSAIGADLFAVLKAQQDEVEILRKRADNERERREIVEFTKTAENNLAHLPGTSMQKAKILKSLGSSLSEEERRVLSKMLIAGDAAMSSAFSKVGHRGDKAAGGDFNKRVSEIRARDNCSRTEALQKARKEHPEDFAAYQGN